MKAVNENTNYNYIHEAFYTFIFPLEFQEVEWLKLFQLDPFLTHTRRITIDNCNTYTVNGALFQVRLPHFVQYSIEYIKLYSRIQILLND
jgi:hypothetical protein